MWHNLQTKLKTELHDLDRFDGLVLSTVLGALLITSFFIWRGDQVGLRLVSVEPADNAPSVSTETTFRFTFDQRLTPPADPAHLLEISPSVSGTVRTQRNMLIFTPAQPLQADTIYTVTLAGEVTGQRGRTLSQPQTWHFHTRVPRVLYLTFDEAGQQELAMVNVSTGERLTLTDTPFGVWDYASVPGGDAVIYAAIREDGGSDLWQLNLQDQSHQILLDCPSAACNGVSWQPNRQRFIYERRNIIAENGGPGPPRLWWYDVSSGETLSVFDDSQLLGYGAEWSPDGTWLGFVVPVAQEIRLFNLETGDIRVIPNRVGEPPVWSTQENVALVPDLQQAGEGFAVHLLKVDPASESLENLSGPQAQVEDDSAVWSPDGESIVFTRKPPRASMGKQLWLMQADGSEARTLTEQAEIHHGVPDWSPDGRYLVYQTFRLKEIGGQPAIWLYDLESGFNQEIAQPGNRPVWIP